MSHRKLLALALTTVGALAVTTLNAPASVADDTRSTEPAQASSSEYYED